MGTVPRFTERLHGARRIGTVPNFLKKRRLAYEDTLNARPVRNQVVNEKTWDDGQTFLVIPRKNARWVNVLSRMFYIPEEKKVYLDEIGAWVWSRCDGDTKVIDMIGELAGKFKINRKDAETSLLKYLKKLAEKRLIGFVIAKR